MAVLRKGDGTVVASEVEMADTLLKQTIGLMFRKSIPSGYAMIFDMRREQYISIHMMFVFFPIDLVYLDRNRRIIDIKRHLRPWIGVAAAKKPARYAIELPDGTVEACGLKESETLEW
ncbi:MAG: hypothetical protein A4E28_01763 [Methanocella sp. PtaU1.Bin125]|nr:MAG: hypothetical protein A4E28_01763 [Methanocella sp. PtaU1.Bin125]